MMNDPAAVPVVRCLDCGKAAPDTLVVLEPHADCFCERCDYPLWFAPTPDTAAAAEASEPAATRSRYPGASGHRMASYHDCWNCKERGQVGLEHCEFCGAPVQEAKTAVLDDPPATAPPICVTTGPQQAMPIEVPPWLLVSLGAALVVALLVLVRTVVF